MKTRIKTFGAAFLLMFATSLVMVSCGGDKHDDQTEEHGHDHGDHGHDHGDHDH